MTVTPASEYDLHLKAIRGFGDRMTEAVLTFLLQKVRELEPRSSSSPELGHATIRVHYLSSLQARASALKTVESDLKHLQTQHAILASQLADITSAAKDTSQFYTSLPALIRFLNTQSAELQSQIASRNASIDSLQVKNAYLASDLRVANDALQHARQSITDLTDAHRKPHVPEDVQD